ncbi:MAG TPA: chemotaxis protein CheW [Candidatus Polarisedimenticolia bacterium]|nr:chemotaxis protein CheW [Candidatus Polarisedimenticolia bacterium]
MGEARPGGGLRLFAGGRNVTVPAASVRSVLASYEITAVPLARHGAVGVLLRMGQAVPVYNLAALLEAMPAGGVAGPGAGQILVIEDSGTTAGFLVDGVESAAARAAEGELWMDGAALLALAGARDEDRPDLQAAQAAEGER